MKYVYLAQFSCYISPLAHMEPLSKINKTSWRNQAKGAELLRDETGGTCTVIFSIILPPVGLTILHPSQVVRVCQG